jgi:hypothetical protein
MEWAMVDFEYKASIFCATPINNILNMIRQVTLEDNKLVLSYNFKLKEYILC